MTALALFALNATADLGHAIARHLWVPLAPHEEREIGDGEHKVRPLDSVEGADAYVIQSLHSGPEQSAADRLCRLLFFIGALKDAGAARVTAVVPYLCYGRKDRRTGPQDPVTTRHLAALFESVGTDVVVTLDVHDPAVFENAFRCRTIAATATPLFVDYARRLEERPFAVISPDAAGAQRAEVFRTALEQARREPVGNGFAEEQRGAGRTSAIFFVGEVKGATALMIDDLIITGTTLVGAARAARRAGARRVIAMVTHGLFMPGAEKAIGDPALDRLVVTDTAPASRLETPEAREKTEVLPVAPLLGEVIRRLNSGRGLADLLVV